jgi:hypothetical protein
MSYDHTDSENAAASDLDGRPFSSNKPLTGEHEE